MEWPQGRTLKEFTILLDPPITMSDVRATPLELPKTPVITPTTQVANTEVTNNVATAIQKAPPKEYGPTKSRDTVWSIAKTLSNDDPTVTHQQMMLALYDNNPKAFYKKNLNALKKGAILQAPTNEQLASRTGTQADNEYREHIALWSSSTKTVAKPTAIAKLESQSQQATTADITQTKLKNSETQAKLTLLTPKQEANNEVAVEGNSADTPIGSSNPSEQANIAIEMAATLEEENKEVKSRLDDLESQVEKLQRLLALKDQQLAQLQSVKPPPPIEKPMVTADGDSNLPLYGGGLAVALLGLFLARRSKKPSPEKNDLPFAPNTADATDTLDDTNDNQPILEVKETTIEPTFIGEEPLLSELSPSELDASSQTQEANPLTECDVYIAYGHYQQAEDLMQNALETEPANVNYKLKLLDVHFAAANAGAFEKVAKTLESLKQSDADTWNSIADMGEDLCPNSSLFLSPLSEKTQTEASNEIGAAAVIELNLPDDSETIRSSDNTAETENNDDFDFDFGLMKNKPLDEIAELETGDSSIDVGENDLDTKLALAQASIDMQDIESAREALNEVILAGDDEQKSNAQTMLEKL